MKVFKGKQDQGSTAVAESEIAPAETLDQVQAEITKLQQERASLEGQSRGHSELIAALDLESIALKEKLAAGEVSVTPLLDALDRKRTESTRKLDGIRYSISNLETQMAPLARRARELAQVVDQLRQDEVVKFFQETAAQLSKQVIDGWVKACRDAYELVVVVDNAVHAGNLDDVHRSQVLGINEKLNVLFQQEGLRPVNEAWVRHESHLFRRMAVVAARPK